MPDKKAYAASMVEHIKKSNSIKDFYLREAELRDIDFIDTDCAGADFSFCDLSGANFSGANMKNCNLSHAVLKSAYLDNADLSLAQLFSCDLTASRLWHADLNGANLSEANLSYADLFNANLSSVKFWNVNITGAKLLSMHNFLYKKGMLFYSHAIDESGPLSAADGYRNLKQYFISTGRYDDASWASFKEKQMHRRQLLKEKNIAYVPSLIMALTCGYGERPGRIILFSVATVFTYAVLYYSTNAIAPAALLRPVAFWDCLYFSIVSFTTVGFGDITVILTPFYEMLAASEAFLGVFVMGLFVYTLTRKYSAR